MNLKSPVLALIAVVTSLIVSVERVDAAAAYFTPVASIAAMQALGTASPLTANVYVAYVGPFSWGAPCTPDNVNTFSATGVSPSQGCWHSVGQPPSVGPSSILNTIYTINAMGDSLTYGSGGIPYPTQLQELTGWVVYNNGVPGNTSTQIAVRFAAYNTMNTVTVTGGSIPACSALPCTGATVAFTTGYEPVTATGPYLGTNGTIAGLLGNVTLVNGVYTFTPNETNYGVTVSGTVPFATVPPSPDTGIVIFWPCRNNYTNAAQCEADIEAMVAKMGTNTRFLIFSIVNSEAEPKGSTAYNEIVAINLWECNKYGSPAVTCSDGSHGTNATNNYFDIREFMVTNGLALVGITPTSQDLMDEANDIPPSSLRISDGLHFNTQGYKVVALEAQAFIMQNFSSTNSNRFLTVADLPNIFAYPYPFGTMTPYQVDGSFKTLNSFNLYQDPIYNQSIMIDTLYGVNWMINSTNPWHDLAIGFGAMANPPTATGAQYNIAIGENVLFYNQTGAGNVGLGYHTFTSSTTGSYNTAVGYFSMFNNISGSFNAAFGGQTLAANTTGSNDTAVGWYALNANTTGTRNVAVGTGAMSMNTSGSSNTALGNGAMTNTTTSSGNTAVGTSALSANVTGAANTAVGAGTLQNSTGDSNTAMGYNALLANLSGTANTVAGQIAMQNNTTGNGNVALGYQALAYNTSGSYNTTLGTSSATGQVDNNNSLVDTNSLFIGAFASRDASVPQATVLTDAIAIGYNAKVFASHQAVLGATTITTTLLNGKVGIDMTGTATPAYPLDVAGDINNSGVYYNAGTAGVTCTGTPTSSFASKGGIVIHC